MLQAGRSPNPTLTALAEDIGASGGTVLEQRVRDIALKLLPTEAAYLRAMALIREHKLLKVKEGADQLRLIVQEHPGFALAWAGLAEAAILLDPRAGDTAIEHARRASFAHATRSARANALNTASTW